MSEADSKTVDAEDVKQQIVEAARKAGYGNPEDGQDYLDRNDVPYDPAEGLVSGTAIHGNSEIPGEHEHQESVEDESTEGESAEGQSTEGESAET